MTKKNRPVTKTDYYFVGTVALIGVAINAIVAYGMVNFSREIEGLGGRVAALEAEDAREAVIAPQALRSLPSDAKGPVVR